MIDRFNDPNPNQDRPVEMAKSVLAVIVLYRCSLDQSAAFRSLVDATRCASGVSVALLVWDNSPEPGEYVDAATQIADNVFSDIAFRQDPSNPGLVAPYNAALEIADAKNAKWLLTLDQDTTLPLDYFAAFTRALDDHRNSPSSGVAFAPQVRQSSTRLSPVYFFAGLPWSFLPVKSPGSVDRPASMINSGAFIGVPFLLSIGGYSHRYQLEYVDHWLSRRIYQVGRSIIVMDCVIEHDLAVNSFSRQISLSRYQGILRAQSQFAQESPTVVAKLVLLVLLPLHAMKQFVKLKDKRYFLTAMREFRELLIR